MNDDQSKGTAALAFSGGLDTSFCAVWLREQGWRVATVTVDTGGFSEGELAKIEARANELGAARHQTIDARAELYDRYIRYLLYANARRGGTYPLCVSAERVCQARRVAQFAEEIGAQALAHGSTGAGNDQVRFDVVFRVTAPDLELLTPVRTLGLSREQEAAYLQERGFDVDASVKQYSVNQGMWGASIGGRETLGSWECLPDEAYPGGAESDQEIQPTVAVIGFDKGVPTALDDAPSDPVAIIEALNHLGARYGIGTGIHLGDTIIGIKGRVGFSAPAAHILIEAHRELEKLTLTGRQLFWKETLGNLYGSLMHEAQYLDPLCRDIEAFLKSSQETVSGEVRVRLSMNSLKVEGVRSPYSLMNRSLAEYGETTQLWDAAEAAGFCKLYGLQQQLAQHVRAANSKEETEAI